jgi:hypothetical protein
LASQLNPEGRPYALIHLAGSSFGASLSLDFLPSELLRIEIQELTDSIFDWLSLIEGAKVIVMIDSVFANLVDQWGIAATKYWIPRSQILQTPVLGLDWTILPAPSGSRAAQILFTPPA